MPIKLANNASTRLASPITSASTSITVESGGGDKFPVTGGGVYFPMTIVAADGSLEIVKCTARSGDTFTIERAQESTTAKDFTAGSVVELRFTAGAMDSFVQELNDTIDAAEQSLQQQIAAAEGFAVGDYLTTVRNPGANWLRRDGAVYEKSEYPELGAFFPNLPATMNWSTLAIANAAPSTKLFPSGDGRVFAINASSFQQSSDWETMGAVVSLSSTVPYNDKQYVAVNGSTIIVAIGSAAAASAGSSDIFTSTDGGASFTKTRTNSAAAVTGIAYFNGAFRLFCPGNQKVISTTDGLSFTESNLNFSVNYGNTMLTHVIAGGDIYVNNPDDYQFYSSNGTSFTQCAAYQSFNSIAFINGYFIGASQSGIYRTTNMKTGTWTQVSSVTTSTVTVHNGILVAAGNNAILMSIDDGATWSSQATGYSGNCERIFNHKDNAKFVAQNVDGVEYLGVLPLTDMFQVPGDNPTNGWIKAL